MRDREAFEERLILDNDFSQAIEAVEFDLIEDFSAGVLLPAEDKQIASWVEASPERRVRVLIAQALHRSISNRAPQQSKRFSWMLWAAPLTACILLMATLPFLRHPVPSTPTPPRDKAIQQAATAPPQDTILLVAERLRGGANDGSTTIYTLHAGSSARIQIMLPAKDRKTRYTVTLQLNKPDGGQPLKFSNNLYYGDADSPFLELTLPPGSLNSGPYTLNLQSTRGSYRLSFIVKVE